MHGELASVARLRTDVIVIVGEVGFPTFTG